jgi:hypothetical protein
LELQRQITFADGTSQNTSSGSAGTYANAAFLQANTPLAIANSAAIYANGAFVQANAAFLVANTPTHVANSAALYANGAFLQANTPPAIANSAALYANGAFVQANAAFLVANTPTHVANSAASYANAAFLQANTPSYTANSAAAYANGAFVQANAAFLQANTPSDVANSAATYANGAFIQANAVFTQSNTVVGVNLTQNTSISSAFIQANAAYTKANSALANTSGTFGGNMFIAGNLSVNGTFLLANSNFTSTESALTISATATTATPSNDGYMIHLSGKDNVPTRLVSDSYGTGAYSLFAGRAARGTVSSPTALQSGDVIARFSGNGYGTTKYQTLGVGRIDFVAAENYTDANTGSQIQFWNCAIGSNTLTNIATFNGDSATFTGTVEPQKGFVYTPTVFPGAQTAITINMTSNSVVRAQTATGLVVTLSNLLAGKEVVAWITNTAGTNQTFTHGVSATNSTVNATTYTIPGTSTIMVRYMCIDATVQNTFVAITHA